MSPQMMIDLNKFPVVDPNTSIRDAIPLINSYRMDLDGKATPSRAILVVDEQKLIGIVQRRDLLKGLELSKFFGIDDLNADTQHNYDPNLLEVSFNSLRESLLPNLNKNISEIMVKVSNSVDHQDHIFKIVFEIQEYRIIPVTENGKVIGLIRTVEIMDEVAKIFNLESYKID